MTRIESLLDEVNDAVLREELQERIDIVSHKIKFMDRVPVSCLNLQNSVDLTLSEMVEVAGGILESDINGAVYVIYHQKGKNLAGLMAKAPALINKDWQSAQNNRVSLLNENAYELNRAEEVVGLIEDIAEILHPGHFIFGHEGNKWIRFEI